MMQAAGFVLVMAYLFFVGWFAIKKLDEWNRKGGIQDESQAAGKEQVLVYGNKAVEKNVRSLLKESRWEVIGIQTITFRQSWRNVRYILAVSASDEENLSICTIGKKLYELQKALSICNDPENRSFFQKAGIQILDREEQAAEEISILALGKGA